MYLNTVARACEDGFVEPVPMAEIAQRLEVSVPSVHEMVNKLSDRGLVTYEPYKGVHLTEPGMEIACRVLRTRRLWATFLVEHLGFEPEDADRQACELEHVTADEAVERLAAFLGNLETGESLLPPGQDAFVVKLSTNHDPVADAGPDQQVGI